MYSLYIPNNLKKHQKGLFFTMIPNIDILHNYSILLNSPGVKFHTIASQFTTSTKVNCRRL